MLMEEIEICFPIIDMPLSTELPFRTLDSTEAAYLMQELEAFREKPFTVDVIRLVYQEMSHLSAKAWRWLLPHYLRFCITPEAEYSRLETEFLIYNLRPDVPFQRDTLERLSLLKEDQVGCLIHFLKWCLSNPFWREYCPDDIAKGLEFLEINLASGSFAGE
jgi:hypothetical protein